MNAKQFEELKTNNMVYVDKNRIYFDTFSGNEPFFVVEVFEFEDNGVAMYRVLDAFYEFDAAYRWARNPQLYLKTLEQYK